MHYSNEQEAYPLSSSKDLDPLLERIGDARFVLLGEASHGTHEYYTWRTQITKRLIQEKKFSFIAVEGDWPDCYKINRYIKTSERNAGNELKVLEQFDRWPTWMWANWEIAALVRWLKEYNTNKFSNEKIGFYGLDVYSLWESMEALIQYLDKTDAAAANTVRKAIHCFEPYHEEGQQYAKAHVSLSASCKDEVIKIWNEVRSKAAFYNHDLEASLNSEQNAFIAVNAENYYRSMLLFNEESWNIRDRHMEETLTRIMDHSGPEAKAIVWEHNTHIGDARFTDMEDHGMVNLGQLVRQLYGDKNVVLVGFGSYEGSVIAGRNWGAPMEALDVPKARSKSVEAILHDESSENRLLIFDRQNRRSRFKKTLPHRAIGVVYNPERDQYNNYVPSVLSERYDAFLYIDKTRALHPLHVQADTSKTPETYPFEF